MSSTEIGSGSVRYDPSRHDNQIVAVYADHAAAERAEEALRAAGAPADAIQIVARDPGEATLPEGKRSTGDLVLNAFMSLFTPAQEPHDYAHAVERGHAALILTLAPGMDRSRLIEALNESEPIDFDRQLQQWRQAGYTPAEAQPGRRVGQREAIQGADRLHSYLAER